MEFLRQNAQVISAFASTGSLIIWTVYAVLFYKGFKRQRSAHLYIHAAGDGGPSTECLIINLSPEPVHILCSIAVRGDEAIQVQAPTDEQMPLQARVKQGPLKSGGSFSLGSFADIAQALNNLTASDRDEPEQCLEIRVAAIHGASDQPVGAARGFLYDSESLEVAPNIPHTEQKRSRRAAREVKHWMEQCGSYRKARAADNDEIPEQKQGGRRQSGEGMG